MHPERVSRASAGIFVGAVVLAASFLSPLALEAENSLRLVDQVVVPGQTNVWFPVLLSNEDPIQGCTLFGTFDVRFLTLRESSPQFSLLQATPPEFFDFQNNGAFFQMGCLFDFLSPFTGRELTPTSGRRLLNLVFNISPAAPVGLTTHVELVNRPDLSRVQNTFTVNAFTVFPELHGATVKVGDPAILPAPFIRGDVDGNTRLDISDAVVALNYLFLSGPRPRCLDAADIQDTGQVNISSAVNLLNFLFLGGATPAVPFPNAGHDPTPDQLPCS
jgi:hypothetical protein